MPACNGVGQHQVLPIKLKAECNGTGPTNRQLQGKVGGVTPAGLSLLIERRVRSSN
jgi:hypothetical protein